MLSVSRSLRSATRVNLGVSFFTTETSNLQTRQLTETFGQPTSNTHPYLLKKNEVQPRIQKAEFQHRRQRLVETIASYSLDQTNRVSNHLIIIPSATKQYMSDKIPYVFRQNTDFMYLSGCLEPDSCLILSTTNSPSQHTSTIFLRDKDPHAEMWEGPRTAVDSAVNFFGVDQALPVDHLQTFIERSLQSHSSVIWYDYVNPIQPKVQQLMQKLPGRKANAYRVPTNCIHQLRVIKSAAEIELMKETCEIASQAIADTIAASKIGVNEHEIFATVDYKCRMKGANFLAYPPVVAGGDRATIIHYINNNQIVNDKEMVLLDAGCELHSYSSDITRTWPVNGTFTDEQKVLYEAVYLVQQKLIAMCYDFPTLDELFKEMCILLARELQNIGLISKQLPNSDIIKAAYEFCPHHVSHYLGMDVHDTPSIPRHIKTEPGMVITIEPGVYITNRHNVPDRFKGIGIRIEDDILITENGPVVLTQNCPKLLSDLENLRN